MAHTLSTAKRMRQNSRLRERNRRLRSLVRTKVRAVQTAIEKKEEKAAHTALQSACATIDKAAKHGVLHANAAARKKSRLSLTLNSISK